MQDAAAKDRTVQRGGIGRRVLSDGDVAAIRLASSSHQKLAEQYGVSRAYISMIVRGKARARRPGRGSSAW